METTEHTEQSPKKHTLLFVGVVVVLTIALLTGLFLLNQRSNSAPVTGDPGISKLSDTPAVNKNADEKKADTQEKAKPSEDSTVATQGIAIPDSHPAEIASTGPTDALWIALPLILLVGYIANEYRRSRAALLRAAMHETSTL